ncbi:hypothetical protein B0H10DRAFT_1961066 [Mycena sp. CBHHK59/15]|nr:hypothetical protein B0H10DRAFT_1961066 [Mycena sp. CBHHK59/15]
MASVSSHNPFRTPAVSPNPTEVANGPPNPTAPPQRYAPPSTPHPDPAGLTDDREAPPAYTPGPDVYQGETTVEYGPSRPFQPAPPPLLQQQSTGYTPPPQHPAWAPQPQPQPQQQQYPYAPPSLQSLWTQLTGSITTNLIQPRAPSWSAYPGRQQYAPPRAPPPLPPPRPSTTPPTTHVSEFARDFYASPSVPSEGLPADADPGPNAGYPPPPVRFNPPPDPPPTGVPSQGSGVPDDGRPTSTPVPGHPLLRYGCMLVYPAHHECHKCNNTGYKHGDHARPCNKCWDKYARPYTGALAYAPSPSPSSSSSASSASSFQRPLPPIYAPPAAPPPGTYAPRPAPTPPAAPARRLPAACADVARRGAGEWAGWIVICVWMGARGSGEWQPRCGGTEGAGPGDDDDDDEARCSDAYIPDVNESPQGENTQQGFNELAVEFDWPYSRRARRVRSEN